MTETLLLYFLFTLTIVRLLFYLNPSSLQSMGRVKRARIKEGLDAVVWAGVVAVLLIHFVVRSYYIPSASMLPALQENDYILVNELLYDFAEPSRGDMVVFRPPPLYTGANTDLIKRVVGVEYDKIEIVDGTLYLNDSEIQEKFILEPMVGDFGPIRVEKDHLFVMGDNRNASRDSRKFAQVPVKNLVGRAEMIFFPISRFRVFNVSR